ncbi:hypothetical protein GCM10012275_62810 [Longimycelium tulufanense]|uniref:Uncharacterized protein n=1 Tax=Longimycelium tulufanense TaxID=907463 RepID=A0A8J3FZD3_9PSEU|nr:hypothetical protein [Longimycelium tulufanense]GGM83653.1 hypothetical protein GCM10012275_62810 [Longimycelium tulufanense]
MAQTAATDHGYKHIYRNESLIQVQRYETAVNQVDTLVDRLRAKWALLREKGYAGDYPVEILRSAPGNGATEVVEVFKWASSQARMTAGADSAIRDIQERIEALATQPTALRMYTEAVRGFNSNFPGTGGVELLKGVCSCLLTVDDMVSDYPMSVKNGIVLMHRSPRTDYDGDGRNEMYLKILMHGGEIIQAAMGPIRVEQNFNRPNDGVVKSLGQGDQDFPGVAMWRVSWRIQTALGPVVTDPDEPLIFGPAVVSHYPPVGTHFHSTTGPVALLLEENGKRVGTLVPGELTAFDIVVTKDDEIYADHLNAMPDDLLPLLNRLTASNGESHAEAGELAGVAEAATD